MSRKKCKRQYVQLVCEQLEERLTPTVYLTPNWDAPSGIAGVPNLAALSGTYAGGPNYNAATAGVWRFPYGFGYTPSVAVPGIGGGGIVELIGPDEVSALSAISDPNAWAALTTAFPGWSFTTSEPILSNGSVLVNEFKAEQFVLNGQQRVGAAITVEYDPNGGDPDPADLHWISFLSTNRLIITPSGLPLTSHGLIIDTAPAIWNIPTNGGRFPSVPLNIYTSPYYDYGYSASGQGFNDIPRSNASRGFTLEVFSTYLVEQTGPRAATIWQGFDWGWEYLPPTPPEAVNEVLTTATGEAGTVNELAGISFPPGDALSSVTVTNGAFGTATVSGGSPITCTPTSSEFEGKDQFTYTVYDTDGNSSTATVYVTVDPVTHFSVTGPSDATAGDSTTYTVTALDANNDVASWYNGNILFGSSDENGQVADETALTDGVGTIGVTFQTPGEQFACVSNVGVPTSIGDSATVTVSPGAASQFSVQTNGVSGPGTAFPFTLTALDGYGNVATGYTGTVVFSSSDGSATLPSNSTLTDGVGTFYATLCSSGTQTITADDTPNGILYDFGTTFDALATTHFSLSAPSSTYAGATITYTVTAKDASNNVDTGYSGTLDFASSDDFASLPTDSDGASTTLVNGVGTFSATLGTVGSQTLTAEDSVTSSISGTSSVITVSPGAPAYFAVTGPTTATAGSAATFTVTVLDGYGNTDTGYEGTVHFSSSDSQATLPSDATLSSGVGTFSATLGTAGSQTIAVADTYDSDVAGTSAAVTASPGSATQFSVSAPGSATAGNAFNITVTALDAYGNVATGYTGVVSFSSSDGMATPPIASTLTNGVGVFSATLRTVGEGSQTISVTATGIDTATVTISVSPASTYQVAVIPSDGGQLSTCVEYTVHVYVLDQYGNAAGDDYSANFITALLVASDSVSNIPLFPVDGTGGGYFLVTFYDAGEYTILAWSPSFAFPGGSWTAVVT